MDQHGIVCWVAIVEWRSARAGFTGSVDAGHIQELGMYRDEVTRAVNPQLRELAQLRVVKLQEAVAKAEAPKQQPKRDW